MELVKIECIELVKIEFIGWSATQAPLVQLLLLVVCCCFCEAQV